MIYYKETIIFGSGISAYFAKKNNPKAIVISDSIINNSIKSGGFFRTKGIEKESLFNSIKKNGENINNLKNLKNFCEFVKNLKKFKEFKNSTFWEFGFKNKLIFLKDFQKNILQGELLEIIVFKKKVIGCVVKIKNDLKIFYCDNIILCTGGFSNYFKKNNKKINPIEICFEKGLEIKNIEFVQSHPFSINEKIFPTEFFEKVKIFNNKNERFFEIEKKLSKKNAHHELSKIIKFFYMNNKKLFAQKEKNIFIIKPKIYYTIGGLSTNKNFETKIKGLFAAGEIVNSISGANRIGGVALSECVYSGIITGKNTKKNTSEKNNFEKNNLKLNQNKKMLEKSFPNILKKIKQKKVSKSFKYFQTINTEKNLKKGLEIALREKNDFAKNFFESAINRKETRGCFIRKDFLGKNEKFEKESKITNYY